MENSKNSPASHTNTNSTPVSSGRNKIPFFNKKVKNPQNSENSSQNPPKFNANSAQNSTKFNAKSAQNPPKSPQNSSNSTPTPTKTPSKSTKTKSPLSARTARLHSRLLSTYYGHPARDMKLICIAGTHGKTTVARFVHDILGSADQQVAIFSSDAPFKASVLHKFLSDAWKAGATHAVITAPTETISAQVFYGLPLHLVALTDLAPAADLSPSTDTSTPQDPLFGQTPTPDPATIDHLLATYSTLFATTPAHVVLNRDDPFYSDFSTFAGTDSTLTYGTSPTATLRIDSSKLYKLGSEANLSLDRGHFTVASFLTGQPIISQMAAAAAIATALHIAPAVIAEGIALYDPDNTSA